MYMYAYMYVYVNMHSNPYIPLHIYPSIFACCCYGRILLISEKPKKIPAEGSQATLFLMSTAV